MMAVANQAETEAGATFRRLPGRGDGLFAFQCFYPLPRPPAPGLVRLMASLVEEGPKGVSPARLHAKMGANGCRLFAGSGDLGWWIGVEGLSAGAAAARGMLERIMDQPAFRQEDFRRERRRQIASIREAEDNPLSYAFRLMRQRCFVDPLLASGSLGTIESLVRLRHAGLAEFFQHERGRGALVGWAGDAEADPEAWQALAARWWNTPVAPLQGELPLGKPWPGEVRLPPKGEQAVVQLAFAAPGCEVPSGLPLLASALSSMDGPLFREVREKRGLAYSVGARVMPAVGGSALVVFASCEPVRAAEVMQVLRQELARVAAAGIAPALLAGTRKTLLNQHHQRRESISGRIGLVLEDLLLGRPGSAGDGFVRELASLTPGNIVELGRGVFARGYLGEMVMG